jgi:hypothetical protein
MCNCKGDGDWFLGEVKEPFMLPEGEYAIRTWGNMKTVAGREERRKYFRAAPEDLHPSPLCERPPGSEDCRCVQHPLIATRYKTT